MPCRVTMETAVVGRAGGGLGGVGVGSSWVRVQCGFRVEWGQVGWVEVGWRLGGFGIQKGQITL